MTLRSYLASVCALSALALTLAACPPDSSGTESDGQASTSTTTMSGTTTTATGSSTTDDTTATTGTTGQPTSSTTASTSSSSTGGVIPAFADVQAIFSERCSCHLTMPSPANGQMELSEGKAYGNIVSVPSSEAPMLSRIEPGDPTKSYLWLKLTGGYLEAGGNGDPMPLGPDPTPEQLDTIEAWILAGAPAE